MQMIRRALPLFLALLAPWASATAGDLNAFKENLAKKHPDLASAQVSISPVAGLYELVIGPQVLYVSEDADYVVSGSVIELATRTNLTEPREDAARLTAIEDQGDENMVSYGPENPKHTITVFTDIDCGYCRKLHREMKTYNDLGIRVRYLAYPRAGPGSDSYLKLVSVWCADDRRDAMTRSKNGDKVETKSCDNPVQDQWVLGRLMGVNGTPSIVTDKGRLIPGYLPAERLLAELNKDSGS